VKSVKAIMQKSALPYPNLIEIVRDHVEGKIFDRVWKSVFSLTARIVPNKVCDELEQGNYES